MKVSEKVQDGLAESPEVQDRRAQSTEFAETTQDAQETLIAPRRGLLGFLANPFLMGANRVLSPALGGIRLFQAGLAVLAHAARRTRPETVSPEEIRKITGDFPQLLRVWGIHDDQVEMVSRNLKIEAWLFLGIAVLAVIGQFMQLTSVLRWFSTLLILPMCIMVAASRLWRADCLDNRQFVPFRAWVWGASKEDSEA